MYDMKKNTTRRHRRPRRDSDSDDSYHLAGWKVVEIRGDAYARGQQHGRLLRDDLRHVASKLRFLITVVQNQSYGAYLRYCDRHIAPIVQHAYPEIYEELRGICDGAPGILSLRELIAWNAWLSMYNVDLAAPTAQQLPPKGATARESTQKHRRNSGRGRRSHRVPLESNKRPKDGPSQRCSAFLATGHATRPGVGMVMAHNTHADLASSALFNVVLYVYPEQGQGHAFVMQTCAGYVASGSDWFITAAGIVGCETTISEPTYPLRFNRRRRHPYFCRVRRAMQYGDSLDDYSRLMRLDNAGDYPGSWLFGHIHTGEIMLCELGYRRANIQRTHNGVFYGMNSAHDFRLRGEETDDQQYHDTTTSSGARNVRLDALLNRTYYGQIDVAVAKRILADHYDLRVERPRASSVTVCNHYFVDPQTSSPYYPHASVDGKVVDTQMAQQLAFWGRWGSSCGMAFSKEAHLRAHPEYRAWGPYLDDLPTQPWVRLNRPKTT